jgi:uncharacterized protein
MSVSLLSRTIRCQFKPSYISLIPRFTIKRAMASSSAPEKFEWLVVMPDQPGKLEKRLEVRP